jgi:hypothetical protein
MKLTTNIVTQKRELRRLITLCVKRINNGTDANNVLTAVEKFHLSMIDFNIQLKVLQSSQNDDFIPYQNVIELIRKSKDRYFYDDEFYYKNLRHALINISFPKTKATEYALIFDVVYKCNIDKINLPIVKKMKIPTENIYFINTLKYNR